MGLSCERTAEEERYLDERKRRYMDGQIGAGEAWPIETSMKIIPDPVNHPAHYNNSQAKCECGRRIECIDVTRHHNFNIGNAIKYLWRCDLKGASVEDLRKAIWYIQDEIKERVKNGT